MDNEKKKTIFVGRYQEISQLQKALTDVLYKNQPRIVLIQGDVGFGKTTLVNQFINLVSEESQDSVWIAKGACDPDPSKNAPFTEILASLIERSQGNHVSLNQILDILLRVAPAWLDIVSVGAASSIVKAVSETINVGKNEFNKKAYNETNVSIQCKNFLQEISRKQPLVIFIDDLQWADPSTLDEMFHLARDLEDCHLMFIGAHRPVTNLENDKDAALFKKIRAEIGLRDAIFIELEKGIDVESYISLRYPKNTFSPSLIKQIQKQTEGHPLFVRELFSLWQQDGTIGHEIVDGEHIWTLTKKIEGSYRLPTKLEEVLKVRLAILDAELKDILRIASIEGEHFNAEAVRLMKKLDETRIYESLDTLKDNYHFITGPTEDDFFDFYQFSHRFLRDYVYDHVPGGWRKKLHGQLGECLENLYQDPYKIAAQLAIHFEQAGDFVKSARYSLMAAKFEFSRYAWSDGENWCEFGLGQLMKCPPTVDLQQIKLSLLEISWVGLFTCSHYSNAIARLQEAVELAEQMKIEPYRRARMYVDLANVIDYEGHLDEALSYYHKAKEILESNNVPFSETVIHLEAGFAYILDRQGKTNEAIHNYRQIISIALSSQLSPAMQNALAFVYNVLGVAYGNCSKYSDAAQAFHKSVEFAKATGDFLYQTTPLFNLADDSIKRGDFAAGKKYAERGLEIAQRIGDQDNISYAHSIRGSVLLIEGHPDDAIKEIREAIDIAEKIGSCWNMPYLYGDLAMANLTLGKISDSKKNAEAAVKYASDIGYQLEYGYALDILAQVEMAGGSLPNAESHFRQAIEVHQNGNYRFYEAQSKYNFATLLVRLGQKSAGLEMLESAHSIFKDLELQYQVDKVSALLKNLREE